MTVLLPKLASPAAPMGAARILIVAIPLSSAVPRIVAPRATVAAAAAAASCKVHFEISFQ